MKKHIYVIPTNRLCTNSIESLLLEIPYIEEKFGIDLTVTMIDSSDYESSKRNSEIFNKMVKNCKKSKAYYITTDHIDFICRNALERMNIPNKSEILSLLVNKELSYGNAANRTFVVAAALNADYIHRRDSDTYLQNNQTGSILSPLELELKFLGKKISEVKNDVSGTCNFSPDDTVYMVGGGYKGNWPLDYEDLVTINVESLYKLVHLGKPILSDEQNKDYVQRRYIYGSEEVYQNDEVSYSVENFIDAGNFSLYKIFNYLPISPASETTGTDYFYHAILGKLHMPMIYHNRRVLHKHDPERYINQQMYSYHLRLVKSRCLVRCYTSLFKDMTANRNCYFEDNRFLAENLANQLIFISNKDLSEDQEYVIDSMVDIYQKTGSAKYAELANFIKENKRTVIQQTPKDVYNYGILTKIWPDLIDAIKGKVDELVGTA